MDRQLHGPPLGGEGRVMKNLRVQDIINALVWGITLVLVCDELDKTEVPPPGSHEQTPGAPQS